MQPPHNVEELASWLGVISVIAGFIWWIVKSAFVKPLVSSFSRLDESIKELANQLNNNDSRLDNHDLRITSLETWKDIKEGEK